MDDLLIFSENGQGAREVTSTLDGKDLGFDDTLTPHLTGARVLAPVMVFKEGDYVTLRRNGIAVPFKADKDRMERWLQNTVRDSAINYDHHRTEGPNETGWLRIATGKSYVAPDPRDGKMALWAQPELGEQALNFVQTGQYRDMSIEIDPETESIVGLALTNHPKVKNITQFSEGEHVTVPKTEPDKTETPAAVIDPVAFADLQTRLEAAEAALSAERARREAEVALAEADAAKARLDARKAEFSDWVQTNLIKDADGLSAVPVGAKDQLVELMLFMDGAGSDVLLFSEIEGAEAASPVDGFKAFLGILNRVQAIGESAPGGLAPTVEDENDTGLVAHIKKTRPKGR